MGVCLCKDKTSDSGRDESVDASDVSTDGVRVCHKHSLSETVDRLIRETLDIIGKVVDNEPEPPASMMQLYDITERPSGWLQLVKSLIYVVPLEHPMGPNVITLLLDDSPLPTKESVLRIADMIPQFSHAKGSLRRNRNFCVILGCLAEKLAGPSSISILLDNTMNYLLGNLTEGTNPEIMLFSLIALEKFAQTSENKATIKHSLRLLQKNPLLMLEKHVNSKEFVMRQVGFCARWCLDNYFTLETRQYAYETVDLSAVNVMLNTKDVSEYLKISPDGLEARCDACSFESVRCTFQVHTGCWYYEVTIITPGVMQIGWATKESKFLSREGYGIGDDPHSMAFDGCRQLIWYNAQSIPHDFPTWQAGSILGCLLDLDNQEIVFSLDGVESKVFKQVFSSVKEGFFAAASFMSFQQCRFNFGATPFRFPPKKRSEVKNFNDFAQLSPHDKIVLPRHLFMDQLRRLSVKEDSCSLCVDEKATVQIEPCKHRGFCAKCVTQLQYCPMCRGEILDTIHETSSEGA
ncbi:RING finger and SPRY domain-containing protein 1 [Sergentomyia squamirostris]